MSKMMEVQKATTYLYYGMSSQVSPSFHSKRNRKVSGATRP